MKNGLFRCLHVFTAPSECARSISKPVESNAVSENTLHRKMISASKFGQQRPLKSLAKSRLWLVVAPTYCNITSHRHNSLWNQWSILCVCGEDGGGGGGSQARLVLYVALLTAGLARNTTCAISILLR